MRQTKLRPEKRGLGGELGQNSHTPKPGSKGKLIRKGVTLRRQGGLLSEGRVPATKRDVESQWVLGARV